MNPVEVYSCALSLVLIITTIQAETNLDHVKAIWSRYAEVTKGDSTYYGEYPGGGACALDPPSPLNKQADWIMVAAGKDDFQKSLGCGMCVEITGPGVPSKPSTGGPSPMKGPYKAYVGDLCGGCKQAGFDLYIPGFGKWKTEFQAIECPTVPGKDGNIQFRFTGSNPWSIKLQARNTKIQTAGMEILNEDEWICMKRTDDNYFTINGLGEMKFPKKVRVTSITGEQLESTLPDIKNDENIPSDIQYAAFNPDKKPDNIKCYGQGGRTEPAEPTSPTSPPASTPTGGSQPTTGTSTPTSAGSTDGSTAAPTTGAGSTSPGSTASPASPTTEGASSQQPTTQPPTTTGGSSTSGSAPTSGGSSPTPSAAPPTTGSSGTAASTTASSSSTAPPSKPSGEDKEFCKGKPTGYYADPKDCNSFYHCANGATYWKQCPKGTMFNPAVKVCDWPRNVKCPPGSEQDVIKKLPGGGIVEIAKKSGQSH